MKCKTKLGNRHNQAITDNLSPFCFILATVNNLDNKKSVFFSFSADALIIGDVYLVLRPFLCHLSCLSHATAIHFSESNSPEL